MKGSDVTRAKRSVKARSLFAPPFLPLKQIPFIAVCRAFGVLTDAAAAVVLAENDGAVLVLSWAHTRLLSPVFFFFLSPHTFSIDRCHVACWVVCGWE